MRSRYIGMAIVLGILALALPATAQVSGTWNGAMETPQGNVNVSYTFMEDNGMLTGTSTGPDGAAVDISEGHVEGANVSFSITVDLQGMPFTMAYDGVLMGDTIEFTIDIFGMPFPLTVTRSDGP